MDLLDIINKKFGNIIVIDYCGYDYFNTKNKHHRYKNRCICGNIYTTTRSNILTPRNPDILSCGCANKLLKGESMFNIWYKNIENHKKRDIKNYLSKDEARQIGQGCCFYCGKSPQLFYRAGHNGGIHINSLDRVHQDQHYTIDNCVASCHNCNFLKFKWDLKKWYNYLAQNYNHRNNRTDYSSPKLTPEQTESLNSERKAKLRDIKRRNNKTLKPGILNNLDKFVKISIQPCYYCGTVGSRIHPRKKCQNAHKLQQVRFNGLDRIDNKIGYTEDNVVPACFVCNQGRSGDPNTPEMTVEDFMSHLDKLSNFWLTCKPKLEKYLKT